MARKISVEILGDASSLQRAFRDANTSGGKFGRAMSTGLKAAAVGVGAAFAGMAVVVKKGFDEISDSQKVAAQTAAVLKSTGGIANVTAQHVDSLATSLSEMSGIDDELIGTGENLLLTFKNVRNEVGKGNDVFDRATKSALDLSVAGFGSVESASKMLGKALNDPVKGMTALGRAGVTFSDDQKKAIAAMVKTGDTLGAQRLILKEVESQVGGSAKAFGQTLPGQLGKLRNAFDEVAGQVAKTLLPVFSKGVEGVAGFLQKLSEADSIGDKVKVTVGAVTGLIGKIASGLVKAAVSTDWGAVATAVRDGVMGALTRAWEGGAVAKGGPGQAMSTGLKDSLMSVDWSGLGSSIGNGIRQGITQGGELAKSLVTTVNQAMDGVDWEGLGRRAGPGLVTMMLAAIAVLNDPAFWVRNWDLILAVALVALGGPIGRVGKQIGGAFGRVAGGWVDDIARAIEGWSPRLADAFRGMMLQAVRFAGAALTSAGTGLINAVKSLFGRLGTLAVFTVKVLGLTAVIKEVSDMASKFASAIANLYNRVSAKLGEIRGAIMDVAGRAGGWAVAIGEAIVDGVLAGIKSLPQRLAEKLGGYVKDAIAWAGDKLHGSGPWMFTIGAVGVPLAQGIIEGFGKGIGPLAGTVSAKVDQAIANAKKQLEQANAGFKDAWSKFTDKALEAFDEMAGKMLTEHEKLLAALNKKETVTGLADAITEAQAALDKAKTDQAWNVVMLPDETVDQWTARAAAANQAVTDAQDALNAALLAKKKYGFEQQAIVERTNLDAQIATARERFTTWLALIGEQYTVVAQKEGEGQRLILKKLKSHVPLYYQRGVDLGEGLAAGLLDQRGKVVDAANELAAAVAKSLGVAVDLGRVAAGDAEARRDQGRRRLGLPALAAGGVVTRPMFAMVGESGPEAVIPLNQLRGGPAAAPTINVYVSGVVGDQASVLRWIRAGLADVARDNPNIFAGLA